MKAYDIRPARKAAGIGRQDELARELGFHPSIIVVIESGEIGIDDETHAEIMSAIDRLRVRNQEREGVTAAV